VESQVESGQLVDRAERIPKNVMIFLLCYKICVVSVSGVEVEVTLSLRMFITLVYEL